MPSVPPAGCWQCGAVPSAEDIRLHAILHPRAAREGGPWTGLACRDCGLEGELVNVEGHDPVLAPPEAAGLEAPAVAVLLGGRRERDLRQRARRWMDRWAAGLERLRSSPPPAPPPPRPRARKEPPPSAVPPPKARATLDLPRTPEEARALLGVDAKATAKEIDAAFRRGSRKCHPDLVQHLDEDFQRLAHEKFLRLKRAQEILRRG